MFVDLAYVIYPTLVLLIVVVVVVFFFLIICIYIYSEFIDIIGRRRHCGGVGFATMDQIRGVVG